MIVTSDVQAKYVAYLLSQRHPSDSTDKLARALVDAQIEPLPHQVDAAMFAFGSPLSKGALLADEVGLGKTIEAGLVIAQRWAERKRRILVVTPANLRKQWYQELQEKFFLPSRILESRSYNAAMKAGDFKPFDVADQIVITSYQFAKSKASDIHSIKWDLVVIDEAHRLRNVYKTSNVMANILKKVFQDHPKLLLTATPLQNSLLELYGLVSFIDEHTFGDLGSFKEQFTHLEDSGQFDSLKARLKPLCHRTLRRQVVQYVPYTNRHAILEPFEPEEREDMLYNLVSDYLIRPNLAALPNSQRSLMVLVLRKLLASSTYAIAGALETMCSRLEAIVAKNEPKDLSELLASDYEALDEAQDEWGEEEAPLSVQELEAIRNEISELKDYTLLARSVTENAKGKALLAALSKAFDKVKELRAPHKAIIFTESKRTQNYLLELLAANGYGDGIVLFNGGNSDERSKGIYNRWIAKHKGTDRITGSRTADMRSALVDYFREEGKIMIATEAGAEGINLQFCALIINYDLPWNPQRVEQRIGRCHRYGQKFDVVVVNFVNTKNEADVRVYELLSKKFKLFEGVFGASDEVLGAIESGVDFEKRIAGIYQQCRTPEEIKASFDELQQDLELEIDDAMTLTRKTLLENFDQEVNERLRIRSKGSKEALSRYEEMLLNLTEYEIRDEAAHFDEGGFNLCKNPYPEEKDIGLGRYELPRRNPDAHYYRLNHTLAQRIIADAKAKPLLPQQVIFDIEQTPYRITILEKLRGQSGRLVAQQYTLRALDQTEDYILLAGITDSGEELDEELCQRMLGVSVSDVAASRSLDFQVNLDAMLKLRAQGVLDKTAERNHKFYEEETTKLDSWAEDLKISLEREIREIDRQIKDAKRLARQAPDLAQKLDGQKLVRKLEGDRNSKRRSLFEAQDAIDVRRETLIEQIEHKLKQSIEVTSILDIEWTLI